jgi:hypothetical protein
VSAPMPEPHRIRRRGAGGFPATVGSRPRPHLVEAPRPAPRPRRRCAAARARSPRRSASTCERRAIEMRVARAARPEEVQVRVDQPRQHRRAAAVDRDGAPARQPERPRPARRRRGRASRRRRAPRRGRRRSPVRARSRRREADLSVRRRKRLASLSFISPSQHSRAPVPEFVAQHLDAALVAEYRFRAAWALRLRSKLARDAQTSGNGVTRATSRRDHGAPRAPSPRPTTPCASKPSAALAPIPYARRDGRELVHFLAVADEERFRRRQRAPRAASRTSFLWTCPRAVPRRRTSWPR